MPPAARRGDPGVKHCSGYVIAVGSPDVFIHARAAARVGDTSTTHLFPGRKCRPHVAPIARGSATVFVNGKALARQGDPWSACTQIASGSPDVFSG